jgi:hypothetical protein
VSRPSNFGDLARLAGRITVGAQELVDLVDIGNRLADEGDDFDRQEAWVRANAALARTVELELEGD